MLICNLGIKGAGKIDRGDVMKGSAPSKILIKVLLGEYKSGISVVGESGVLGALLK